MLSIDNSEVLNYDQNNNNLTADVTFSYNAGTKVLTITDETDYPAGDSRKAMNISVFDKFGGKKEAHLGDVGEDEEAPVNSKAIDLDADDADGDPLNVTEGVSVIVTLVSANGKVKDGTVHDVATLKADGSVTMQK